MYDNKQLSEAAKGLHAAAELFSDYPVQLNGLRIDSKTLYLTLSLTEEAGEVAGKVKRAIRGDYALVTDFVDNIVPEMGDVLYCWITLADTLGIDVETIIATTLKKYENRTQNDAWVGTGGDR